MAASVDWTRGSAASLAGLALLASFTGCSGAASSTEPPATGLTPRAAVGEVLFHDTALSVSGQQSCSTCHDQAHAFAAANGSPDALLYNDLPLLYNAAVNIGEPPYTPPSLDGGRSPTLMSDEIDAVVAFLCTLTDGFDPDRPEAYALPAQCTDIAAASRSATVSAH